MRKSTQWDVVGALTLVMAFVSFDIFIFGAGSLISINRIVSGLGNPLLTAIFFGFSFVCFVLGYLESKEGQASLVDFS